MKEKIIKWIQEQHFHLEKSNFKDWEEPMEMNGDDDMAVVDSIELEKFINKL
jgi:hypothetical protein